MPQTIVPSNFNSHIFIEMNHFESAYSVTDESFERRRLLLRKLGGKVSQKELGEPDGLVNIYWWIKGHHSLLSILLLRIVETKAFHQRAWIENAQSPKIQGRECDLELEYRRFLSKVRW